MRSEPLRSVLVVEDEGLIALLLREVLTELGLDPHVFMEGKPALESIGGTPYAAAILDLGLPDIDGNQVVEALLVAQRGSGYLTGMLFIEIELAGQIFEGIAEVRDRGAEADQVTRHLSVVIQLALMSALAVCQLLFQLLYVVGLSGYFCFKSLLVLLQCLYFISTAAPHGCLCLQMSFLLYRPR